MARRRWFLLPALLTLALAGCGQAAPELPLFRSLAEPRPAPTTTTTAVTTPPQVAAETVSRGPDLWPVTDPNLQLSGPPFHIAQVNVAKIGVYDSPTAPAPLVSMGQRTEHGLPRVFLVASPQQDGDRWKVLLPVRPNGAVGWIRAADVSIQEVNYWMRVSTATHTMTVGNGNQVVLQEPVAVGTGGTPTPKGTFYLYELVRPIWQPYLGPYAYSTSAFSDVLYSFMGGNGNVGVHGTDAPGSIGRPVSHGCIRMTNSGITKLAGLLPLGTPLFVTA